MSAIVAAVDNGESGDDVGDTVSFNSAGFVIVPGFARTTLAVHFPVAPATLHDVCAWPAVAMSIATIADNRSERPVIGRGARGRCRTPRFPRPRFEPSCR